MTPLNLMVYRHSAFYSPLIGGVAGGFFEAEGFTPTYTVMPAGKTVGEMIASGEIHVSQSAVSASWPYLEKGQEPPFQHFATINRRDGFVIASRTLDPDFRWDKLAARRFMFVHGGQPQAMLAYALHKKGVDFSRVNGIDAGAPDAAMAAFRSGQGDYFHEQAPYPQQLEVEGHAHIVASVGEAIGPVAFSSLAAAPAWLEKPEAVSFVRAFRTAREWVNTADPAEVAAAEQAFFPHVHRAALTRAILYYQKLGCWAGNIAIAPALYETALDVFAHSKLISRRHAYDRVVVNPPG
jgi:NitT/TauT family transport system substrate-binding protein